MHADHVAREADLKARMPKLAPAPTERAPVVGGDALRRDLTAAIAHEDCSRQMAEVVRTRRQGGAS